MTCLDVKTSKRFRCLTNHFALPAIPTYENTSHPHTVRKNIAANFGGRLWAAVSVWLFTPLYLKYLGGESYGLLALYGSLFALASVFDLGMTATLNRELARLSATNASARRMRDSVRTLECLFIVAVGLMLATLLTTSDLAAHWFRVSTLGVETLKQAVSLMGLAMVPQLLSGLYIGALLGLQRQVLVNVVLIANGLLRGAGAIFVLSLYPTANAYFKWQIGVNTFQLIIIGLLLWSSLPHSGAAARFDLSVAKRLWRYSAGMAAMSVTGAALMNLDRLILSRLLPLNIVGYYALAATLASVPLIATGPVNAALLPALTRTVALGDHRSVARIYHSASQLVSVLVFPTAILIAMFSPEICRLWLRDTSVVEQVQGLSSLLVIGPSLMALTCVPYAVQLAHGCTSIAVSVNLFATVALVPILIVLVQLYGVRGACVVSMALGCCLLGAHIVLTHRRFLADELWRWSVEDTLAPMAAAWSFCAAGRFVFRYSVQHFPAPAIIFTVWLVSELSAVLVTRHVRASAASLLATLLSNLRAKTARWEAPYHRLHRMM